MIRCILGLIVVLGLCSCTDEQIARAQEIVRQSDAQLERANKAVAAAETALETARTVASQLNSEQSNRVIAQADQALDQVKEARNVAEITNKAAHSAVDAATQAQAAGGSTIGVIGAAATGALPGILAAIAAAVKWMQALRSFRQTVAGLDAAKVKLAKDPATATVWKDTVAPELDSAQDKSTKLHVDQVQLQAKAKAA